MSTENPTFQNCTLRGTLYPGGYAVYLRIPQIYTRFEVYRQIKVSFQQDSFSSFSLQENKDS